MGTPAAFALSIALGYLLGALPMGYLVGRSLAGTDVRTQGSGKTGATNVRRVLGWKGFFLVYLLDVGKGAAAVLVARALAGEHEAWAEAAAGLAAVVGHNWPVFLAFKGGRGVAVGTGATLAMVPEAVVISILMGVPVILVSRYISLGSLTGAVTIPTIALAGALVYDRPWPYALFTLTGGLMIIVNHKDNIQRLLAGTERRI